MPTNAINDTGVKYIYDKLDAKKVEKETGKGLSTNDYTTTDKNKVSKIDITTTSISGNPISISGLKANQLAINPIIMLEPIQAGSGTPSPSNVRAISGYDKIEVLSCGKNLFDKDAITTGYRLSNTTGEPESDANYCVSNFVRVKANTAYYVTATSNSRHWFYDVAKNPVETIGSDSAFTYTPTADGYIRISIYNYAGKLSTMQITQSSTAQSYEPYHKTTDLSESLGQTVYGLTHEVRTGKATVTYKSVDLGNLDYSYRGDIVVGVFSNAAVSDYKLAHTVKALCEKYNFFGTVPAVQSMSDVPDKSFALYYQTGSTATALYIKDTSYNNATTFKASLSGVKLVYELANPTEIQLTPHEISLLKDYAYVSTNGTNIALDYHNGELASLADVSQLGETVNELSQAFQDGCDEIMGVVAAKGVTPASNSPDDISKAIRSLVTYEQPIEFDYRCGYIMNGVWYYEKPTDTLSDIYEVKNGHTYYMFFGNTTGTRFRAITTTTDIRTVTSGTITSDQSVKNSSNPGPLSYVTFTSTVDGYFIVCKDNVGKTGITTYMQDRTTM